MSKLSQKPFHLSLRLKTSHTVFLLAELVLSIACFTLPAQASPEFSNPNPLIRRLAVFPIHAANLPIEILDDGWWRLRTKLTDGDRFLVAGRRLMESHKVFKSHLELNVGDVILLGRLLDANALVLPSLEGRQLKFVIYESETGHLLWKRVYELSPFVPIPIQLADVIDILVEDFKAGIPYQAVQVSEEFPSEKQGPQKSILSFQKNKKDDELLSVQPLFEVQTQIGDVVQWIEIRYTDREPAYQSAQGIKVIAEGLVDSIKGKTIRVRILKRNSAAHLALGSLIRLPDEAERLRAQARWSKDGAFDQIQIALSPEAKSTPADTPKNKSFEVAIAFLGGLASFLLIAF